MYSTFSFQYCRMVLAHGLRGGALCGALTLTTASAFAQPSRFPSVTVTAPVVAAVITSPKIGLPEAAPGVVLRCLPPKVMAPVHFTAADAEELRQDYACFLTEMQDVAKLLQGNPYSKGVLAASLKTSLRQANIGEKSTAAMSGDAARALGEARDGVATLSYEELRDTNTVLSASPNWRQLPAAMHNVLSSPTVAEGLKAAAQGTCPADLPGGVISVQTAKSLQLIMDVMRDCVPSDVCIPLSPSPFAIPNAFRLPILIVANVAKGLVFIAEGVHTYAKDCSDTQFQDGLVAALDKLDDKTRFTDDVERDAQTTSLLTTLNGHVSLKTKELQDTVTLNATANLNQMTSSLGQITVSNEAQTIALKTYVTSSATDGTKQILDRVGKPGVGTTLLIEAKGVNSANTLQAINAAKQKREDLRSAIGATRNLIYANDNANATRALAELASRTERLRIATCETIRLTALNNGLQSECASCADQPGFPYGDVGSIAYKKGAAIKQSTVREAPVPLVRDVSIETQLLRNIAAPLLCLPASNGGRIEDVKALVWSHLLNLEAIGIKSDTARTLAVRGDKFFSAKEYVSAFHQYALAYQQLTRTLK